MSGVEMILPGDVDTPPVTFKAIVQDSTSRSLILESFFRAHVAGKTLEGVTCSQRSLGSVGISRVAFSTTLGNMRGEDPLNDKTAPKWKVSGIGTVHLQHQGYSFKHDFFVVNHIFCRHEFESQFVAILGMDFLQHYFIRAQWTDNGFQLELPARPPDTLEELVVFTDGCCLSNGQSQDNPARGGYGIHFPQLSRDWDIGNLLPLEEKHTNQRAELVAVIRALHFIYARGIPCNRIRVLTDSMYAVQGLNDWIPMWKTNGYRTAQKKAVANKDLFQIMDKAVEVFRSDGVALVLEHVPREANRVADGLAKAGARGPPGSIGFSLQDAEARGPGRGILGRNLFDEYKSLVQWTPDGLYWSKSSYAGGDVVI
ncbi:MAG: hypothetical protein Q9191_008078 [Dirinaria sp. TL-2023a]